MMTAAEAAVWAIGSAYIAAFLLLTRRAERRAGRSVWLFRRGEGQRLSAWGFRIGFACLVLWPALPEARIAPWPSAGWAAVALALAGAMAALAAQVHMGRSWRIGTAPGELGRLVEDGPFAWSRNPVFAGQIALFWAPLLAGGNVAMLAPALLVFASAVAQARLEERVLLATGGDAYRRYAALVPRWLGRPRAARPRSRSAEARAVILDARQIQALYARAAPFYDAALHVYDLAGVGRQRRRLVRLLDLAPGDVVVDLGCGTGANFAALHEAVGPEGRIIGVWRNIELVEGDLRDFPLPSGMQAVVAAFALEMVEGYAGVGRRIARALPPGGRLGALGLKHSDRWPHFLVSLGVGLNRPFGVSRDYASFRPWIAMRNALEVVAFDELMLGAGYLCVGRPRPPNPGKEELEA